MIKSFKSTTCAELRIPLNETSLLNIPFLWNPPPGAGVHNALQHTLNFKAQEQKQERAPRPEMWGMAQISQR